MDTFNDERRAYQFYVNPLGVQMDSIYDDTTGREDESWNAIWDSAGQITATGFMAEMAIPLKQLRFTPSQSGQTWGIDFARYYPRDYETKIVSNPQDRDISCYLCQIRKADGFADLQQSRNLEVIPTLTAISTERRDPAGSGEWVAGDVDPEAGANVRWGITQDMYLNATINPDFSQVEADAAQLAINNTFSLFFPERRTFFLDGADYFDTAQNLVHTRNIAEPDFGAKLTGKSNGHTYGLLSARDNRTSFLMPRSLGSSVASLGETQSDVTIGRYRYDIFNNSTIGALVTDRRADGYNNTVLSLDAILRLSNSDTVTIQTMRSATDYPDQIQQRYNQQASLDDNYHFCRVPPQRCALGCLGGLLGRGR